MLQERLQKLAEDELPESQCGFREGRSCTDMIFTIQQLVEKSWEHTAKSFFTFIDLKKAYDSVPREAMWLALKKLGLPDETVQLICSFHQGMKAKIRLDGSLLEQIDVQNGLRQGCCMAPVLFNLFTCLVVERLQARVEGADGVGIKLNIRNADMTMLTECLFADDGALLSVLFGWLPQKHPRCGPRRRWRDMIRKDLRDIEVKEDEWYEEATRSRAGWRDTCRLGMERHTEAQVAQSSAAAREVECEVCSRKFRRESEKKRHKCLSERNKPVSEQRGGAQCQTCRKWFRSRGGLAVHTCRPPGSWSPPRE